MLSYPIGALLGLLVITYAGQSINRWVLPYPLALAPMAGLVFALRWFRRWRRVQPLADGAFIAGGTLVCCLFWLYVFYFVGWVLR